MYGIASEKNRLHTNPCYEIISNMRPVQDTKRSHDKKSATPPKKRTVPLPLEIIFRPDQRGTYNRKKVEYLGEDEDVFQFEFESGGGSTLPVEDPWLMRTDFLRVVEDGDDPLDGVTLVYGRFGVGIKDLTIPSGKLGENCHVVTAMRLLLEEYREWQALVRAAMKTAMSEWPKLKAKFSPRKVDWLCQPMALAVQWRNGRPTGIISCSGILEALIATLQIDALIGAEYRFCACEGCRKCFKVKRKDQRYCDERCKHRQVVRNVRNKERYAANQQTNGGTDK